MTTKNSKSKWRFSCWLHHGSPTTPAPNFQTQDEWERHLRDVHGFTHAKVIELRKHASHPDHVRGGSPEDIRIWIDPEGSMDTLTLYIGVENMLHVPADPTATTNP